MSLVYTQTAMPFVSQAHSGLSDLIFCVIYTWFQGHLERTCWVPARFLLRLEFGKHEGDVSSISNPVLPPIHFFSW